jgi:hypothetical protein
MKELHRFRQFLTEGKLLKEDQKYYSLLNDLRDEGLLNKSGISGLQSKFNLSKEKAKEIFDEYLEDLKAEQPDAFDFFMKEGVIKENITKLDNYALEIYSDFRKDPSIHFPDVEFEVDEEGFALENDSNYSQLKKYKREIMGLHALFGEESGVKDKNGLQLSMDGVIDNI